MNDGVNSIDSLIRKLEHLKTRIVFDSRYPMISLVFRHIVPYFSSKRQIFVVYSDTMCRRLENIFSLIKEESVEVADILEEANIIKIGLSSDIPFGSLYGHIPYEEPEDIFSGLRDTLMKLDSDDLLIFYGTHLIPALYGSSVLSDVMRLFDALPKGITLFTPVPKGINEKRVDNIITRFYDVILKISKEENIMCLDEETYLIGVMQSYIKNIPPGFSRFRVRRDGKLVKA